VPLTPVGMVTNAQESDFAIQQIQEPEPTADEHNNVTTKISGWKRLLRAKPAAVHEPSSSATSVEDEYQDLKSKPEKWSLGVLNDRETDEVPGIS